MAKCGSDAFELAQRGDPMNVAAVIQHTSGEYLGLIEDHLEGRKIRFQYYRPFASGGSLPEPDLPADALFLLGGGPWGAAGTRDLPTLDREVELTRLYLERGTPIVGLGIGAQILALASGGGVEQVDLAFECVTATRVREDALNGFLPEEFSQVIYMRDFPVPPAGSKILAEDERGRPAVWEIAQNAYGFAGNPGIKLGMVEDLVMEFEEVPANLAKGLAEFRGLQKKIADELVPIMTGLVQCTKLMNSGVI